jgi:hypothetical protein
MANTVLDTLDARPDRVDLRDREYQPRLRSLPPEYPSTDKVQEFLPLYRKDGMVLDQGQEGACTGFGLAAVINYLFWRDVRVERRGPEPPSKVSERMLYHLARFYDEWPGEDYDGSSCRGAMKGWHHHGVCSGDLWPYRGKKQYVPPLDGWDADAATRPLGAYYRIDRGSLTDMQAAILEVGAIYVSASVHDGWFPKNHRTVSGLDVPVIGRPHDPSKTGGHAFALVGYNAYGFIVQNSWGEEWGFHGFAVLPYEDWVERAMDAWVAVMGAPMRTTSPHYQTPVSLHETASTPPAFIGVRSRGGIVEEHKRLATPWGPDDAYRHAVVMGNNGIVLNRSVTSENAVTSLARVVEDGPRAFMRATGGRDVVLYAHGGLNDETAAVTRARILGPHFEGNGAYPIFFVWKTGFLESVGHIVGDATRGLAPQGAWRDILEDTKNVIAEAKDRAIEVACQDVLVRTVWKQMKQNAEAAATQPNATLKLVAEHLERVRGDGMRLHLVGHSAGSILLGHLLDLLLKKNLPVQTCTLLAPACTVRFALEHYGPATDRASGILNPANTGFEILGEQRELADSVGPYGKSLLYLVSRALEDYHRTPILGMANVWAEQIGDNPFGKEALRDEVRAWQSGWKGSRPVLLDTAAISDGEVMIPAAHGSFDNDVAVMTRTLMRIRGHALHKPIDNLHGF